ncbi:neuronal PAS domain-containing protein 4-like [Narcine bancroftii]|uniref:neuronal PAS domain-containing protein 4-like n=1 Tax=Narcine bancroftii TaxID=1343680 RepID=UPI0038313423
MYRSTKGASKARRDQINAEIRNLKELLPISDADKSRLSYLHIMSLACIYTRKSVFFSRGEDAAECLPLLSPHELTDFVQSLPGFLIALSSDGKLIYVSENVSDHLGHSLVDLVAQGDSIYDITDPLDHLVLSANLMQNSQAETERLFRCRFNTSRSVRRQSAGNKMVLVRGRYHQPPDGTYWSSKPVFVAFCAPLDTRPRLFDNHLFLAFFESRHSKDMMVVEVSDSVTFHLGYKSNELIGTSWYSLVHPQDLAHASARHYLLVSSRSEARVEMVVRLQSKDSTWVWIYLAAQVESAETPVVCHNYCISEAEAWCLRQQLTEEEETESQVWPYALSALPALQEPLESPAYLSSPDTVFTSGTPTSVVSALSFDFSGICGLDFAESSSGTGGGGGGGGGEDEEGSGLSRRRRPPLPPPQDEEPPAPPGHGARLPELSYGDCSFLPESPTPLPLGRARETYSATAGELCYRAALYERLPPSPDSPGHGGGVPAAMGFQKLRAPLYIHVAPTPEGLLTPEASPIKIPPGGTFGTGEGHSGLGSPTQALPLPDAPAWRTVDFTAVAPGQEGEDPIENLLKDLEAPGAAASSNSSPRPVSQERDTCSGGSHSPALRPATDLSPEERSLLEELASYETVFETFASRSPCDGFNAELYQLQRQGPEYFHPGRCAWTLGNPGVGGGRRRPFSPSRAFMFGRGTGPYQC